VWLLASRQHLLARGPGIKAGSTWDQPATQVDLAHTFLGIAGLPKPPQMDGKSLLPLLVGATASTSDSSSSSSGSSSSLPPASAAHVAAVAPDGIAAYALGWRDSAFIEYYFNDKNAKCMESCTPAEDGYPHKCDAQFLPALRPCVHPFLS
jgi:hypothetical protein